VAFKSPIIPVILVVALASMPGSAQNHSRKSKTPAPEIENPDVDFTAEVERGKTFEHDIGHDLIFRLEVPETGDYAGWDIMIVPKTQPADGPIEFSAIATPPYHSYNERYIDVTFGFSAKEILEMSPRRFNFVMSENDEHRAEEVVNVALYPNSASDDEKQRVAESSENIQLGTAEFKALKYRITSIKDPLFPGSIEWMRFEVKLKFPPALTMAQVLAPADVPEK
jgi:hypothetical protein